MYGGDDVAPPGNQAETENTNIDLQRWEKLIYSTSRDQTDKVIMTDKCRVVVTGIGRRTPIDF